MKVSETGTARFAKVVEQSGKPEVVSLWAKPERDKPFMTAVQQNRVMTIKQETVSSARDFGIVGFLREKNVSYLVFPKPLNEFKDRRIVGIKYDLIETARPVGRIIKPIAQKLPKARKTPPVEWQPQPERQKPQPRPTAKPPKRFTVTVRFTAAAEKQESVEADSRKKAKETALQQVVMPDLRRGAVTRKVVKISGG